MLPLSRSLRQTGQSYVNICWVSLNAINKVKSLIVFSSLLSPQVKIHNPLSSPLLLSVLHALLSLDMECIHQLTLVFQLSLRASLNFTLKFFSASSSDLPKARESFWKQDNKTYNLTTYFHPHYWQYQQRTAYCCIPSGTGCLWRRWALAALPPSSSQRGWQTASRSDTGSYRPAHSTPWTWQQVIKSSSNIKYVSRITKGTDEKNKYPYLSNFSLLFVFPCWITWTKS